MQPANFYHIYNRGNNRERIFFNRENYIFFINKIEKHLLPHVHLLAYCLMPNHFHFLAFSRENVNTIAYSNDLQIMLRSYTRAINNQEDRTGSLFQQNTKVKELDGGDLFIIDYSDDNYPLTCFHYIHQNPLRAGLVRRLEDWEMSSYQEYMELRENQLISISLAKQLLDLPDDPEIFMQESIQMLELMR